MSPLRRVALLSITASITTLLLKFGAYLLTGSVSLLERREDGASWDGELAGGIPNHAGRGSKGAAAVSSS